MSTRRGTKAEPFIVGEKVKITSLNLVGEIVKVIHPPQRGQMRYRVRYRLVDDEHIETINCGLLLATTE